MTKAEHYKLAAKHLESAGVNTRCIAAAIALDFTDVVPDNQTLDGIRAALENLQAATSLLQKYLKQG